MTGVQTCALPILYIWRNDLAANYLLTKAVLLIQPSFKEGFGLTVTEGLWHGLPVIGGKTGGIQDQVINNITGILIDPSKVKQITNAIGYIITHPDRKSTRLNSSHTDISRMPSSA